MTVKRIIILTFNNPDALCKQDISLYICMRLKVINIENTKLPS